jgi:hypothetical protein
MALSVDPRGDVGDRDGDDEMRRWWQFWLVPLTLIEEKRAAWGRIDMRAAE